MLATFTAAALALLAVVVPQEGESERLLEHARFTFFAECQPVQVTYEVEGIDEDRVQTLVESRLRAARLYRPTGPYQGPPWAALVVQVTLTEPVSHIRIGLYKMLYDPITRTEQVVETWSPGSYTVRNNKEPKDALSALSESVDRFILEYLRVNEHACDPTPRRID